MVNINGATPTPELTKSMSVTESLEASSSSSFPGLESVLGGCFSIQNNAASAARQYSPLVMDYVRNPVDGSVLIDHNGVPISVERLLSTKPLKPDLSTRPGPGNKKLTYMSGEVVTRTLNLIFGYDGWNLNIQNTQREECVQDEKGRWRVVYTALVRVTHIKSGSYREDCGMGDALDKNMGIAISHAQKASVTDAMKRAARHFGEKLGNSLYHGDFSVNRAPASLQHALDRLDSERAKLLGTVPPLNSAVPATVVSANKVPQTGTCASSFSTLDQVSHDSTAGSTRTLPCAPQQGPSNTYQAVTPTSVSASHSRPQATAGIGAYPSAGRLANVPYAHTNTPPPSVSLAPQHPAHPNSSTASSYAPALNSYATAATATTGVKAYCNHVGVSGTNPSNSMQDANAGNYLQKTKPSTVQPLAQNNQSRSFDPASIHGTLPSDTHPTNDAMVSSSNMPPPTSTQGLQSSNLFGNKRDAADSARPFTSMGRKSDPLPLKSESGSLYVIATSMCDSIQHRAPFTTLPNNVDDSRKKAKINPYA